jgi:hypothetical protein
VLAGALLLTRAVVLPWPHLGADWSDFAAYWGAAGQLVEARSPYLETAYLYPPATAALCVPLAHLPYVTARRAWFALSLLAVAAAIVLLARTVRGLDRPVLTGVAVVAVVGTLPENLVLGQLQPLLLLLLAGAHWAARRRRQALEGMLLGLAAGLKLWPALLALLPLAGRRWRAFGVAAGVAATLVIGGGALAAALPGPARPGGGDFLFGTPSVFSAGAAGVAMRAISLPLRSEPVPPTWYRAGGHLQTLRLGRLERRVGATVALLTLAAGLAALAGSGLLSGRPESEGPGFAALLTLALVALPVSWYHSQLLQVLTLALLLEWWWPRRRGAASAAVGLVLVASWSVATALAAYVALFGWGPGPIWLLAALAAVAPASVTALLLMVVAVAWGQGGGASRPITAAKISP